MSSKIRVFVIDDNPKVLRSLVQMLSLEDDIEVVGDATGSPEVLARIRDLTPDVALIDLGMTKINSLELVETLGLELPDMVKIIMSIKDDFQTMQEVMRRGGVEFLVKPFTADELMTSTRQAARLGGRRAEARHLLEQKAVSSVVAVPSVSSSPAGKLMAVISAKGGAGTTITAINLATQLQKEAKSSVCLVDLDLQYGDVGVMMNLKHHSNIITLVQKLEPLSDALIDDTLVTASDGMRVLLAPLSPELAELVTAAKTKEILELLQANFDYVVVDGGNHLTEPVLTTLDSASRVVLVSENTLASIKNTKLLVKVLGALKLLSEQLVLVINNHGLDSRRDLKAIGKVIGSEARFCLPADVDLFHKSLEKGVPMVQLQPNSEFCKVVLRLATELRREVMVEEVGLEIDLAG